MDALLSIGFQLVDGSAIGYRLAALEDDFLQVTLLDTLRALECQVGVTWTGGCAVEYQVSSRIGVDTAAGFDQFGIVFIIDIAKCQRFFCGSSSSSGGMGLLGLTLFVAIIPAGNKHKGAGDERQGNECLFHLSVHF